MARKIDKTYKILTATLLFLIFAERIYVLLELGADYCSGVDDFNYVPSGIYFGKTGVLAYDNIPLPSALIMPGMPLVIGLVSRILGDGAALWAALKVIWSLMGTVTAYYIYKSTCLAAPKWCGLIAMSCFLLPNQAWMNNVILTETPYMLALTMCIYYTILMGRSSERRYFLAYFAAVLLGLLFRSNMLVLPFFSAVYVFAVRKSARWKELLRRACFMFCTVAILTTPWAIRNYIQFDAFIPFTYGVGNPMLLGTYQGENYPLDEELDYETNVDAVVQEKYARYFDEYGSLKEPQHEEYIRMETDSIKARYRISQWLKDDPFSYIKSLFYTKPRFCITWVWYWHGVMGVEPESMHVASQINFVFCCLTVLLSLLIKQHRKEVLFLCLVYWGNMLITSFGFITDRYCSTLMACRYILFGIGFYLIAEAVKRVLLRRRQLS